MLSTRGVEALGKGEAATAREALERIVAAGQADVSTYLGIAFACRGLRDTAGTMAAVDQALALEPRNLRALTAKGDFMNEAGDAAAMNARYAAQFESFLQEQLSARGLRDDAASGRFRESLDLLFGKREIYFQAPRYYFFPGLPQIQLYDRERFAWLDKVEDATAAGRDPEGRNGIQTVCRR